MNATCALCSATFEAKTAYALCPHCWTRDRLRELDRIESARYHTQRANLPSTLTLTEWLTRSAEFNGLCAYCLLIPFSYIWQVDSTKGLVYDNVVPACRACHKHLTTSFEHARWRVEEYVKLPRMEPLCEPDINMYSITTSQEAWTL
jgi:hypothetical protein